jgi:hypothetical protein
MPSGRRLPDCLAVLSGLFAGRGDGSREGGVDDAGQWRWYIKQATSSLLFELPFVE